MRLVEGVMNGANRGLVGSSGLLWLLVRNIRPSTAVEPGTQRTACGAVTIAFKGSLQELQARPLNEFVPSPSKHSPHPPVPRTPNNTVPTFQKCPLPHKTLNFPPEKRAIFPLKKGRSAAHSE